MIHIYCGDGKGKTTAALGLMMRYAGSGGRVYFLQFLKGSPSSERSILARIPEITVRYNTKDFGFVRNLSAGQKQEITEMHNRHFQEAVQSCKNGEYGMLVLDECLGALSLEVLDGGMVRDFLQSKQPELEVVLTGRNPPDDLLKLADYVSEVKKIKHPFDRGILARDGIEK